MTFNRRRLVAGLMLVALLLGSTSAFSAPFPASVVTGRVFGSDLSTPLPGIAVSAYAAETPDPLARAITDANGRFRLDGLPEGLYLIVLADAGGATVAATELATRAGERQSISLALPPAGPGEGPLAPAAEGRFARWLSTPAGATVTILVAAVLLAVAANELSGDNPRFEDVSVAVP